MIYGNINSKHFEQELAILPRPLQNAIRILKDNDLANHEPGRFDLDFEGVPVILQVLDLTTAPRETLRPEIHRKNIDVQFLASGGPEEAGFYWDNGTSQIDEDLLDTQKYTALKQDLAKAQRLLYICDNCGEILLDKLLIEQLQFPYPHLSITAMVRPT